jgi:hypothetical protein
MLKELFGLKMTKPTICNRSPVCFLDGFEKPAKKSFCNFYLKEVFV